jgi:hypothetical protein
VQFAVSGRRNKVSVAAAQGESTVPAPVEEGMAEWMKIGAWVLGTIIAICAMFFTLMQVQGWQF